VFTLAHYEALSYAEIARILEIPVGTVKSRMAAAVRMLRERLPREELEDGGAQRTAHSARPDEKAG
jgi:DNA-directed RNA polymerase specialized sigma24 family protein